MQLPLGDTSKVVYGHRTGPDTYLSLQTIDKLLESLREHSNSCVHVHLEATTNTVNFTNMGQ